MSPSAGEGTRDKLWSVGRIVAERYRIERTLGEGAMGAVYLAEHVHMRKRYALKILHPEIASPEIVARFEREAVAAANIQHPGIATATDFGRLDDGSFFLVLEYVTGNNLRTVLEQGPMHPKRALGLVRQILLALAAAHAKGVIHRDIKPENVMMVARDDGQDQLKVLDFGIAKIDSSAMGEGAAPGSHAQVLTRLGAVYGTPTYMAPEQGLGTDIDARADLYAVGVMLYELITGCPPFEGDGILVIAKHVNDPPPPLVSPSSPSAVTPELRGLVSAMLAKLREDRPADAYAALDLLERADASIAAPSTNPVSTGKASDATVYGKTQLGGPALTAGVGAVLLRARIRTWGESVGLSERRLLAFALVTVALFILVVALLTRRPDSTEVIEEPVRHQKRHATTAPVSPPAESNEAVAPSSPEADPAPSSSSDGTKGGAAKRRHQSLGSKIRSIFH
ncbi:MAG: hypothetical protein NVS3B20_23660 [Polyangiales bacterium]